MIANPLNKPAIDELRRKISDGEPLSVEDGIALYQDCDIHTLGELANSVRERLHDRRAYYNVNRHINYSNYCVLRCKFCSFYRPYAKPTETPAEDGYEHGIASMAKMAGSAYKRGATEVHIVGGLHPTLPFSYYLDMCRAIREACPHLHIKAFTAIEIIHFTRISKPRLSIEQVLDELRSAGLGSLPGGGAEIFDDRVHDEAYKTKVGEAEWFDVHRTAHDMGIFTNATMLYGHVETPAERIQHLIKLRDHQAASLAGRQAHFNCLIPLPFIPQNSELSQLAGPSGLDNLRTLAVSRLICANIPHIKAFWIMQTAKLAQVSLNWGVDDLDGTVVYYDITKRDEANATHQELSADGLRHLMLEAGCTPVERDTLYRHVRRSTDGWRIEGEDWSVPHLLPDEPESSDAQVSLVELGISHSGE